MGEVAPAHPGLAVEVDEPALIAWGRRLGERAVRDRPFIALIGPLGAGKTSLAQAICEGAGVCEPVTSPTFALVHRYASPAGPVYHADLYRIAGPLELLPMGWEELTAGEAPVLVEWADRAGRELPADRWEIRLSIGPDVARRRVEAVSMGDAPPMPTVD